MYNPSNPFVYHHFRFRGPRTPVDFVFVPRHNFPPATVCVAFSFLRFLPEWDPSAFRRHRSFDPRARVFRSRNTTGSSHPIEPIDRISVGCHLLGRGRGKEKGRRGEETRGKDGTGQVERRETTKEKFPFLQGKRSDVSCPSDSEESVSRPFSNRVFPCN